MSILELKPSEFAGAIAHVAASQLTAFLAKDQEDGPSSHWYGGDLEAAEVEDDVLAMAKYIDGRNIPAEQLWRWGNIHGILAIYGDYQALPLEQRLAFEVFVDVCASTHHRLELAQLDAAKLIPGGEPAEVAGLKLEDSIFEPHGSLGDQEPYQKQFLQDQAAADAARLAAEAARDDAEQDPPAPIGGAIVEDEPEKPASMSVGTQGGAPGEKDAADQGQGTGEEAAADPGAQGDVAGLSDEDGAGGAADTGAPGASSELDAPLAKPEARKGEGGTDPAGVAAVPDTIHTDPAAGEEPGDAGTGADGGSGPGDSRTSEGDRDTSEPAKPVKKSRKGKSTS